MSAPSYTPASTDGTYVILATDGTAGTAEVSYKGSDGTPYHFLMPSADLSSLANLKAQIEMHIAAIESKISKQGQSVASDITAAIATPITPA